MDQPARPPPDSVAFNRARLVHTVVAGQVANHVLRGHPYRIGRSGRVYILPGSGGISLNVRVGDRAVGLAGDHVEPGASLRNNDREVVGGRDGANRAFMALSCVGNRATVLTGPAAGARGVVTGKHGGINHVLVDFPPEVLRTLRIGDRMGVEAVGQGMRLRDHPSVTCLNLSPRLLRRWGLRSHGRHLHVPVSHLVPASLLGSGLGRSDGVLGDCDVELTNPTLRDRHRLGSLRLGDLVAVWPATFAKGPSKQAAMVTIGVVVHSDSGVAGHGPGVTPLLMGPMEILRPMYSARANLALRLGLRTQIHSVPDPEPEERELWRAAAHGRLP